LTITIVLIALLAGTLGVALVPAIAGALVVQVPVHHADAILVLSGAPVYFGRAEHAGRMFLAGRATTILLTNDGVRGSWSHTLQRNPLYYERAILRLTRAGVPRASIEVLPGRTSSTFDESMRVREYALAHSITSLIVVTSDYHTRRALWTVRKALRGMDVNVGIEPTATLFADLSPANWRWHLRGWRLVLGEYVKLGYYRVRYSSQAEK